jgi:hypothetical protein
MLLIASYARSCACSKKKNVDASCACMCMCMCTCISACSKKKKTRECIDARLLPARVHASRGASLYYIKRTKWFCFLRSKLSSYIFSSDRFALPPQHQTMHQPIPHNVAKSLSVLLFPFQQPRPLPPDACPIHSSPAPSSGNHLPSGLPRSGGRIGALASHHPDPLSLVLLSLS